MTGFDAPYAEEDEVLAARLLAGARLGPDAERRIDATARDLIGAIRAGGAGGLGGVEALLTEFALSTR